MFFDFALLITEGLIDEGFVSQFATRARSGNGPLQMSRPLSMLNEY